jgi:hypothetical protein
MTVANIIHSILSGTILKVEGFDGENKEKNNEENEDLESNEKENENEENENGEKEGATPSMTPSKTPSETPAKLMDSLKEKALDLQDAQKQIISGFQKIEPYMDKAETLIGEIQNTAKTIQGMRDRALNN